MHVHGIQKWQKDTLLMKSSKLNQWLYFLSASILLSHPFSSLSASVPPGSLLTSSSFKNFLLNFSLLKILLCLLILFTHLPCAASSIVSVLNAYRGLQRAIQQQNASLVSRPDIDNIISHFPWSKFWISLCSFDFLGPWHFVLTLFIPWNLCLTWFGAFMSRPVELLARACTI